jgi:CRP-like cAMP-binding protein
MTTNPDAVRREFPQIAHLTDEEIAEQAELSFRTVVAQLKEMKQLGAKQIAEREARNKDDRSRISPVEDGD